MTTVRSVDDDADDALAEALVADDQAARVRFASALVADDRLFLEAMRDPHAAAAHYGITLTEDQAAMIRCLQPEAIEKLRERMLDIGLWHTPDHYWGRK